MCCLSAKVFSSSRSLATPWYKPPENLLGGRSCDMASDIWRLGCTLAEVLSHKSLFSGQLELDCFIDICRTFGNVNPSSFPKYEDLKEVGDEEVLI